MNKVILIIFFFFQLTSVNSQIIKVGAKHFNEGYILSEMLSLILESEGYTVERKFNLGGTLICYQALVNNEIDVYPEYSGTISEAILKYNFKISLPELKIKLNENGFDISGEYGFNNTYAFAVRKQTSDSLNLNLISEIKNHPDLKIRLSYEFIKREDGWKNLSVLYNLPQIPLGLEHGLAYKALEDGQIDLTDVYSTDGEIPKYNLTILKDDENFFPEYSAVSFYKSSLDIKVKNILNRLAGMINNTEMQKMNSETLFDKKTFSEVAYDYLNKKNIISKTSSSKEPLRKSLIVEILPKLIQHIKLTAIALFLAVLIAVPLGVIIYKIPAVSKPVLYLTGLLQTIPSIALLAIMIPFFGIGVLPAIIALFLYGLLPIMRNTAAALFSVDPLLKEVASGMGLSEFQKLIKIELPLSMPSIIAGIRTAAVINIGTATLAAFIGAGGLGEFIVTGLALNDTGLILTGAVPAALLAVFTEIIFELLEKILLPKHLLLKSGN